MIKRDSTTEGIISYHVPPSDNNNDDNSVAGRIQKAIATFKASAEAEMASKRQLQRKERKMRRLQSVKRIGKSLRNLKRAASSRRALNRMG